MLPLTRLTHSTILSSCCFFVVILRRLIGPTSFIILGVNDFIFGHPIAASMPRRSFVICPVGHVQVPGSSFPFPIPHSPFPVPIFPFPLLFSFSSSHSCSSSPRLIALISSDSDYCCLRIVQLMCELRHCLKRRSTTRIRFRLRLATKLSSRIGIDFKCECETSTILVWLAGWLAVSARQLLQSLFTAGRLAFSTQI